MCIETVEILRADGRLIRDVRPLVRVNVQVTVEKDGRRESGSSGAGGRAGFAAGISPDKWQDQVDEALRMALVNLDAVACPAGEMDVVLGPGWNGVLLHEAVGHGLEGDFNRKGISAFSGRIGERMAAPGVTVFAAGLLLSMPIIAMLLVANIALGVLTRAAPQLNLFAVGFPIPLTAGFIGVLLLMNNFAPVLQSLFERGFDSIGVLLDALAPLPAP